MRAALLILLLAIAPAVYGQQFVVGFAYQYLHAPAINQLIRTYNFSRPFIANKQPLLQHGVAAEGGYLFKSNGLFTHGASLCYRYQQSAAANNGVTNSYVLHILSPGYVLRYYPAMVKDLYGEVGISVVMCGLFRNLDGSAFRYDDQRSPSLGLGGSFSIKVGYRLLQKQVADVSAFVRAGYAPYVYTPNNERVINQTSGLVVGDNTNWLQLSTGISALLKSTRKK